MGQTLTADITSITDADGLDNAEFSYQWVRNDRGADADIPGATGSTYTLTDADLGHLVRVRVSFTDDAGNDETLTSAATNEVAEIPAGNNPATGVPTISGTVLVGETLAADTSGVSDADGLDNATFSYQWLADSVDIQGGVSDADGLDNATFSYQWLADGVDIQGATDNTYTLVAADEGKTIQVRVSFTDDGGNEETLTSAATAAVAALPNIPATGLPTISGTAQVGETLTADTSAIADGNGLDATAFRYQWLADGGDIQDATDNTYTLVVADVGKTIKVGVSFTDDGGNEERLTSAATAAVAARANNPPTGAPTINGTAQVGETLTADTSGIADEDGLDDATFAYQWTTGGSDISGATDSSYTLTSSEEGQTVQVRVSFTDDAGNQESLTSAATAEVVPQSDNAEEEAPVWSADMLVVEYTSVSIGAASADLFSNVGGSAGLQVKSLWSYTPDRDLRLEFTEGVAGAEDLTLQVGDLTLEFPAGSSGQSSFRWKDVDVDWEDGQTLAVRIVPTTATVAPQPNSPATGAPTISGTAQVGETLTADTSGIADADGLDNASFTYQWVADDTDIDGATDSTYTLADSDQGKAIKVRVSFTDDANNEETLTSAATATMVARPNSAATGAPSIGGAAQVGETLTADTSEIADSDGLTNVTFSYQWLADDAEIAGATGSTYTLVDSDEGKAIKVKVSFTDDRNNEETRTSTAMAAVAARPNTPATGVPAISGTVQVGQTLTADVSGISDTDGLDNVSYSYQWLADDTDIAGATASTYTLTASEQSKAIKVRVTFTDDRDNAESLTSEATAAVAARPNTPATGVPAISGTVQVGQTLTADVSGISDTDGLNNVTFSYQWLRNDDAEIAGANGETYTLAPDDEGKTIKVKVSFNDEAGNPETLTSAATTAVAARPNSPATGLPTISGTAQVDETLTADTSGIADSDGLAAAVFTYQWLADDAEIQGATGSTYTLTDDDAGKTIKVTVSFTDDASNEETLTSAATGEVEATLPGAPQHVRVSTHDSGALDVAWEAPTNDGGSPITGYKVQWKEAADSWDTAEDVSEATVSGTTHTISELTGGAEYTVQVIATNAVGDGLPSGEQTGTPGETVPPELVDGGLRVDGATLRLSYNEALDETSIPSTDAFVVKVVGSGDSFTWRSERARREVESVSVTGSAVELTLATAVAPGNQVVLSYTPATDEAAPRIRDAAENAAPGFDGTQAINDTEEASPPQLDTATVNGATLTLTYDEALDGDSVPATTPFEVTVGSDRRGVDEVSVAGSMVTLTLASAVVEEDTVTVSYTPPSEDSAARIQDQAGTVAPSFSGQAVVNDTPEAPDQGGPDANTPATGQPTISGTAQMGETLTADTSGIDDEDGLENAAFSYQWLADDTDISGATDSTYTLTDDDVGKTIKVRVSFADDASNEETLTSAPTEPVTVVIWSATLTAGSGGTYSGYDLSQGTGSLSDDEFSLGAIEYSVVLVTEDDEGMLSLVLDRPLLAPFTFHVGALRFSSEDATPDEGDGADTYRWDKGTVDWSDGEEVELSFTLLDVPLLGVFASVPETHDGQTVFIFELLFSREPELSFKTLRDHAFTVTGGTVTRTPRLDPPGNLSWKIHVKPNSDGDVTVVLPVTEDCSAQGAICTGSGRPLSNHLEVTVPGPQSADQNAEATGAPTISGTVQAGQTLTANTSGTADDDGLTNVSYSYQWLADDAEIQGATDSTYTLTDDEVGKTIKVRVTFTDDRNDEETLTSTATAAVTARPNSPATGEPTISGTAQAAETLTANISAIVDADGLANVDFSYQWLADDADIQDASDSTYTLTDDDVGKAIKVRVTFTDDRNKDETLTSAATDAVAAKPDSSDTTAPPGDPSTTVEVTVGDTVAGEIEELHEVDWFRVHLLASETYQIDMRGAWGGQWALVDGEIVWISAGTLERSAVMIVAITQRGRTAA